MSRPYRPPPVSRASASTLCQKCLKRGHYSYECKAAAQDRPYTARPSRTQQLLNPKLAPKLTSDTSNDLLNKKGAADELLAKKAVERKRSLDHDEEMTSPRKRSRSRSISSYSSSSYTSSSLSRSPSPRRSRRLDDRGRDRDQPSHHHKPERKRRRSISPSSSDSYSSDRDERNTRRRVRSRSPQQRGRRRSRSPSYDRRGKYMSRSRSASRSEPSGGRPSRSPGRPYRGRMKRESRSPSPEYGRRDKNLSQWDKRPEEDERRNGYAGSKVSGRVKPMPSRERSLSPYSKRLALTQAMNMGR